MGYEPGEQVAIALGPAVSEIYQDGAYVLASEHRTLNAHDLTGYLADLSDRYPFLMLEDGIDHEDWEGWKLLTDRLGHRLQLVSTTSSSPTRPDKEAVPGSTPGSPIYESLQIGRYRFQ